MEASNRSPDGFQLQGSKRETIERWVAHPAALAFPIAFAVFLAVALLQGEKPFYYDAGGYWGLSETFVQDGHFSILNYENTGLRGYALPLIYHFVRVAGQGLTESDAEIVMVFNTTIFASIGTVLAPALARIAWPQLEWGVTRRLALSGLVLVFWHGYLSFPLSDFPAVAAALLALIAVSNSASPTWMLLAGVSAGLAVNFRPAYLLLVPVLLLLASWQWVEQSNGERGSWPRRLACLALLAAGFALVSLPQSLSQHERFGSYSPLPGGSELAGLQYTEGLNLQRYETFVGGDESQARMNYVDAHTDEMIAELDGEQVGGTWEYVELVATHPLTMGGVFLRHAVNGLDQRYTTPYVEELAGSGNRPLRFAGFLIVFLTLVRIAWPAARRRLGPARWRYPVSLLLVSSTALASAMETRFMLPVFLLCATLALCPGWISPIGPASLGPRRFATPAVLLGAAIVFFLLVGVVVSDATDSLRLGSTG